MLVMTPILGRARATRRAMSPVRCKPISTTSAVWSRSRLKIVIGTPVSVLRFPMVRRTLNRCDRTAAAISLVDVLPLLPVMATTRGLTLASTEAARS